MPRIRSLKMGFFQNEDLCALSTYHRLLFAGLWLLADREGRLEDRPKRIEAELFPYEDIDARQMLSDLAAGGFIRRYENGGTRVIQVVKFLQHQRPHPRESPSVIPSLETARTSTPVADADPPAWRAPANPHASPAALINGHRQRRHGSHAWCCDRGLCVPASLHDDLLGRSQKSDAELRDWYAATIAKFDGQAIGDDTFVFWRNESAAWLGIVTSKNGALSGDALVADVERHMKTIRK